MIETALALLVLAGPFAAALLLGCCPPLRRAGRWAALVSLTGIGVALWAAGRLAVGFWLTGVEALAQGGSGIREVTLTVPWLAQAAPAPLATLGVLIDPLSAAMAALVALVAGLVQLYSLGYLADEAPPALGRYYLYQSLFAFAMLGLVFAPNFLQLFVFWELVGLCSYLLIGFYYQRPAAARAAVKAFWVTKVGDVGFLLGIVLLWGATGTFEFATLFRATAAGTVPANLALYMTLIYLGAVGKSAQFPLHVWLPDAMEGPTPVSALIHAATMVTAGVFLVARAYPLFLPVPWVLVLIAYVGAFTALLAATLALGQRDIKRVLAYSTVSQLGYMMTALGAGALAAGVLHLLLHGFFKALLFLAAGAVIHAVHTNDMWAMGRLGRAMPKTAIVFVVGTLALAGVPPFSGFISKEAILGGVWEAGLRGPFVLLSVTVFLTALYMFRAVFVTFFGSARCGGPPARSAWRDDGPAVAAGACCRSPGQRSAARRSARPSRSSWGTGGGRACRTAQAGSRRSRSGSPSAGSCSRGSSTSGARSRWPTSRASSARCPPGRPRATGSTRSTWPSTAAPSSRWAGSWGGSTGTSSMGWSTCSAHGRSGWARTSGSFRPAGPRTISTA